jgi:hypothetical protein
MYHNYIMKNTIFSAPSLMQEIFVFVDHNHFIQIVDKTNY